MFIGRRIFIILIGIIAFLFTACNEYSISEIQADSFLKYYPLGIPDNSGMEVIQTLDGGYEILVNYTDPSGQAGNRDIQVIMTDEFGRQAATSPLENGTDGDEQGNSIIQSGNGFIIAGYSVTGGKKYGYLSSIGGTGQLSWQRTFSGYPEMEFSKVVRSQDGGLILTGHVENVSGENKALLFKTTADGDSLWMQEAGFFGFNDMGASLLEYNNRILLVGTTSPVSGSGSSRLLILNSNLNGKGITELRVEGQYDLEGREIVQHSSGDIFILGNENNPLSGQSRIFLARLELSGGENEIMSIGDSVYLEDQASAYGEDMIPAEGNVLALCGWRSLQNDYNIYFARIGTDLQVLQWQEYGSKGYQAGKGLCYTSEGGYALTGTVNLGGGRTSMLLKLDSDGELK